MVVPQSDGPAFFNFLQVKATRDLFPLLSTLTKHVHLGDIRCQHLHMQDIFLESFLICNMFRLEDVSMI